MRIMELQAERNKKTQRKSEKTNEKRILEGNNQYHINQKIW
jgi:hypothetical protein